MSEPETQGPGAVGEFWALPMPEVLLCDCCGAQVARQTLTPNSLWRVVLLEGAIFCVCPRHLVGIEGDGKAFFVALQSALKVARVNLAHAKEN